jgi:hypothetical protein
MRNTEDDEALSPLAEYNRQVEIKQGKHISDEALAILKTAKNVDAAKKLFIQMQVNNPHLKQTEMANNAKNLLEV